MAMPPPGVAGAGPLEAVFGEGVWLSIGVGRGLRVGGTCKEGSLGGIRLEKRRVYREGS